MRIATVDAVSGHTIQATLSIEARGTPIKGCYVVIEADKDLLLGRVVKVDLTNVIHQDPVFAPYIMEHGSVPNWSREVDIERAEINVIGAVDETDDHIPLRRNPSSGTPVALATESDLWRFFTEMSDLATIGTIPNSGGLSATIINRDFGTGGWDEGQHTVICGQNGSGKSVLATTLVAAKSAAHPQMGLLIPDTAGDLLNPESYSRGDYQWNYLDVLRTRGIEVERIGIDDIRLTSKMTLAFKLAPLLTQHLSSTAEKTIPLAGWVADQILGDRQSVRLEDITVDNILTATTQLIPQVYTRNTQQEKLQRVQAIGQTPMFRRNFERDVEAIRHLFDGRHELGSIVRGVLENGRKVLLDLFNGIDSDDQKFVIRELMNALIWRAGYTFRERGNRACNALCVLDEGTRWIPEGDDDDSGDVCKIIKRALLETRKFGLGWMVIAQRPSGISKVVLSQARTKYFGRGLGVGADARHLDDCLQKEGVEAYKQLELQGGYFWIGVGMDNNVGTESSYFTFHPFAGNATQAFINANRQIFG